MKLFGVKFAPINIPIRRRLQTLAAATGIIFLIGGGYVAILVMAYILIFTRFYWLGLIYIAWIYYDRKTAEQGGRRSKWVRNWSWWYYYRDYFPIKLVRTDNADLDPSRNYLLCCFPHGLLCTGPFACFATDTCDFKQIFPGITPYMLTLGMHFNRPFFRELIFGLGTASASAKSINYLLGGPGTGRAAALPVGGAAESFYCRPGQYKIVLKRRKGFVKLALKNGSPLVPVISFGETDLFSQVENPEGSFMKAVQEFLRKATGIAPIMFFGRGFFQYNFGLVPHRTAVTTVVGSPLEVGKIENPTDEQINEVHEKFTQHLVKMFEQEKHKYLENPDETQLIID